MIAFGISLGLTGILIPKILLISFRKNLFDEPDERKIHKGVIPRLGGIAFMPAVLFAVAAVAGIDRLFSAGIVNSDMRGYELSLCFGLCSMMMLYLVGIADDLIGVKYRAKFIVQFFSAISLIAAGIWIKDLHGFLGIHEMSRTAGWTLTIVVAIFITNAINLIDGIDGLASGLSATALTFYGVLFFQSGQYVYAMIAFAVLGTLVPFFYYNVFGNQVMGKKIFMGDTGSLTIGVVLTFLSIAMCNTKVISSLNVNSIVLAFSPLIVPCFDVMRVFFGRIRKHQSPFHPDRTHIHHKLLALGINQRVVMVSILLISATFTVANILLSSVFNVTVLVIADVIVWTVFNMALSRSIRNRQQRQQKQQEQQSVMAH